MSVLIKLKENNYIEYNKSSDTFSSKILNKEQVMDLLKSYSLALKSTKKPDLDVDKDSSFMFKFLEQNNTTDLGRGVNLAFVLKYNESGPGRPLTLSEIFEKYS